MSHQMKVLKYKEFYLFLHDGSELRTEISTELNTEKHRRNATFTRLNGQPFNDSNLDHPLLFAADAYLRSEKFLITQIQWKEDQYIFPLFESMRNLPHIEGVGKILHEEDRYDGPTSGIIALASRYFWFEWCMDSANERDYHNGARRYSLREISQTESDFLLSWSKRKQDLRAEFRVIANPHIYPISAWQRSQLRRAEEVEQDLEKHDLLAAHLKTYPITAWIDEGVCSSDFDAIHIVSMEKEKSERLLQWQRDVAQALFLEDQKQIDQLFATKPKYTKELEIFRCDKLCTDGTKRSVLRDCNGKPLPEKFWMTGFHCIQDFTHLLKAID